MSQHPSASPRIAIIGAGISGLACARALADAGVDVHVFEKSRGVAGRMSTRRDENGQCDHGAQYFTARDPAFRVEVQRWIAAGAAALWTPALRVYDGAGAADGQVHQASVERFVGTPGMTAPGRLLAQGLHVQTGFNVSTLQHTAGHWQMKEAGGALATGFDAVLLAMPAPQAHALLQDVEPALAALAGSVHMRPSFALMLHCNTRLPVPFDAAFVNAGPLRWIARDSSKPGRPGQEVWLLHGTPAWSAQQLDADRDLVAAQLLDALQALIGCDPRPGLRTHSLHRWLYADAERTLGEPCLWNAQSGVGLCGDWLQDDKVEGAWKSGRALAAQVLVSLSGEQALLRGLQCLRVAFASVQYQQTLQLREAVLRQPLGLTLSAADLQAEEAQWHFALLDASEALLACVLAVPGGEGVFKLRQMAVRADLQGRGLGALLMQEVEARLVAEGARSIILHARVSAAPFYQRLGYLPEGEDFEEVTIPHRRMRKALPD